MEERDDYAVVMVQEKMKFFIYLSCFDGITLCQGNEAVTLKFEVMYEDDYDYEDEPSYDRYNGSYAQDVEGYDDDTIDNVFDGDPDAYWNID
jgi:hypothetical protein